MKLNIGYVKLLDYYLDDPVRFTIDLEKSCHAVICGSSGTGKSYFMLYVIYYLIDKGINLYIADFKCSGDYIGITKNYSEAFECVDLIDKFYQHFMEIKEQKTGEKIMLICDEFGGLMNYISNIDKKKAQDLKNKVSQILMLGRELPQNGSAWIWIVLQRADSDYFSHGSRDNFMLAVGFGRLSKESKAMLFTGEEFPENYFPETGVAAVLEDGFPLRFLQVPKYNKDFMQKYLLEHNSS